MFQENRFRMDGLADHKSFSEYDFPFALSVVSRFCGWEAYSFVCTSVECFRAGGP